MEILKKTLTKIFYEYPVSAYEIILLVLITILTNLFNFDKFILNHRSKRIKILYYCSKLVLMTINKNNGWEIISYSTKALKLLNTQKIILPIKETIYSFRACARYVLKDYKNSLKDCNKTIDINPESSTYFIKALLYDAKGRYNKAIEIYNKIIGFQKKQNRAKAYYYRALTNKNLNKYKDYKKDLFNAIKEDPKYIDAYYERAIYYYGRSNFVEYAINDLNTIINLNKNYAYAYGFKALILTDKQKYTEAIDLLKKAEYKCNQQKEVIYNALSYIYFIISDYRKSLSYADRAILYNKECGTSYYRKACALISLGRYKNVGKILQKANKLKYYEGL